MTIEQDAIRYQWIKAQTNMRLGTTHAWWINTETGRKYWPTHDLDVNGSRFSGVEHLDDLIDQAMELYPTTASTL
jgi:hypothetical protein